MHQHKFLLRRVWQLCLCVCWSERKSKVVPRCRTWNVEEQLVFLSAAGCSETAARRRATQQEALRHIRPFLLYCKRATNQSLLKPKLLFPAPGFENAKFLKGKSKVGTLHGHHGQWEINQESWLKHIILLDFLQLYHVCQQDQRKLEEKISQCLQTASSRDASSIKLLIRLSESSCALQNQIKNNEITTLIKPPLCLNNVNCVEVTWQQAARKKAQSLFGLLGASAAVMRLDVLFNLPAFTWAALPEDKLFARLD